MKEFNIYDYIREEYSLLSEVKHGNSTNLFLLYDNACGRKVLLKSGRADLIENEARILAKVSIKGIPEIYHCFEREGTAYLFRQYIEGRTLRECIEADSVFSLKRTLQIGIAVCKIIAELHKYDPSIIHRDIKSDNIILTHDGEVYIIDFGIAREFNPASSRDTVVMGTPSKAPPEQFGYGQTDVRSDVYSVGALLHEMVTGEDALDSGNPPRKMAHIIKKCTMFSPDDRYHSIVDIEKALGRLLDRKKRVMGAAAVCIALPICFAFLWGSHPKTEILRESENQAMVFKKSENGTDISQEPNKAIAFAKPGDETAASPKPENKTVASKNEKNKTVTAKKQKGNLAASRKQKGKAAATKEPGDEAAATNKQKSKVAATKEPGDEAAATNKQKNNTPSTKKPINKTITKKEPKNRVTATKEPKSNAAATKKPKSNTAVSKKPEAKAKATKEPDLIYYIPIDYYYPGDYIITDKIISKDILEKFDGDVKMTLEVEVGNLYSYANFAILAYMGENGERITLKNEFRCHYEQNEDGFIGLDEYIGAKERQTECIIIIPHDFIPKLNQKGLCFQGINVTVRRAILTDAD